MAIPAGAAEKSVQWHRELLMERIRSQSQSQHKSFQELSKAMRMSMLEKRYALDAVDKSHLQKCLDKMQHCIKVKSRQGLVERLESLSRQLGLKFMEDPAGLFISTDMFYLEIILNASGALTDVKVHHECKESKSCSELVDCLNRGDFADFTVQLEGLSSIYQLNAEPKVKTKAFVALQAMEKDLYYMFQMQNFSKDMHSVLEESIVGIALKRRGGHPMKLTYFVSPYDLISLKNKSMEDLTIDLITSRQLGLSVTVNLEASSANKLQILPTVSVIRDTQTGLDVPVYASLNQMNSILLPATFVLRLNKPLPVCAATLRSLRIPIENIEKTNEKSSATTIMNLVVQTASDQQLKNSQKGLFVCLPDQTHCYFFTDNKQLQSTLLSNVPFTEPSQVPTIIEFLRKQAMFYTLLASCVRSQSKMGNDMDSTTILEVNAISFQQISVALQHPYEESMATVEFDLSGGNGVQCTIFSINHNYSMLSQKLTSVVQKSLSIPITIRAMLRYWDQERMKMFQRGIGAMGGTGSGGSATGSGNSGFGNFSMGMGSNDPGGGNSRTGGNNSGIKLESNVRQQMNSAAAGNAAVGTTTNAVFMKFKAEHKEDFHESPKSKSLAQNTAVELSSSLGQQMQQQNLLPSSNNAKTLEQQQLSSDIKIADKYKNIWKDKTPNLKNSVSITPIANDSKSSQQNVEVKRTGIEIIPLTIQGTATALTTSGNVATASNSTITITPINSTGKDKKSSSSSSGTSSNASSKRTYEAVAAAVEAQKEKKRKKKRDDSPMGPPEKVYSRQNSPAASDAAAVAVAVARKFSSPASSPKGPLGASSSPSSSLSSRPSPKHSPVYSSPKHTMASPTHSHSPKHGSSGKPSMSTLKSAAASPKSEKSTNSLCTTTMSSSTAMATTAGNITGKSREKDKSSAAAINLAPVVGSKTSPIMSGLNSNLKNVAALNMAANMLNNFASSGNNNSAAASMGLTSMDLMRKGVTTAVSLMTTAATAADQQHQQLSTTQQAQQQQTIAAQQEPLGSSDIPSSTEYMVKTSQEGLKMTINKTNNNKSNLKKSKSSSTLSTSSNAVTKKLHTGLKPGVLSGPSSKKANAAHTSSSSSSFTSTTKHGFQKSNSSGNLLGKLSSNNSLGTNSSQATGNRFDHHVDMMTILQYASPNMAANMEGFMKGLNSKFQIPKLSQRMSGTTNNNNSSHTSNSTNENNETPTPLLAAQQSVSVHILKSPVMSASSSDSSELVVEDATTLLTSSLNAK